MIELKNCVHGEIYRLGEDARNLSVGAFSEVENAFIGIRYKFGMATLDLEYHSSTDVGTATPIERIGKVPDGITISAFSVSLFDHLIQLEND